MRVLVGLLCFLGLSGCDDAGGAVSDAFGGDARLGEDAADSTPPDAGEASDADAEAESASPDAADGEAPDALVPDANPEASAPDATSEASAPDAVSDAEPDARLEDAGPDARLEDAAADACVPECVDRCGADGCGGECAACPGAAPLCREGRCVVAPPVIISEVLAVNDGSLFEGEATPDWVELQNRGLRAVELEGWGLTDDPEAPGKWRFPPTRLEAGGVLLVFASGLAGPLHANFRLDGDGEYLALTSPEGVVVDAFAPAYPRQVADVSYGSAQTVTRETLVAGNAEARYRVAAGAAEWTGVGFEDGAWARGPGPWGFDEGGVVAPDPENAPNLALGRPAVQSSQLGAFGPELATDGDLDNFTHTIGADRDSTWEVDLGETFFLNRVRLHNRRGAHARLRDITVSVLDEAEQEVYASALLNPENALGGPASLDVDLRAVGGVVGRHVRVHRRPDEDLSGSNGAGNGDEPAVLSLAEVEVFGGDLSIGGQLGTRVPAGEGLQVRLPFDLEAPEAVAALRLEVRYDAGFVAYLNGEEVARRNLDEAGRPAGERLHPLEPERVLLTEFAAGLEPVGNVLAVQALNTGDGDLLLGLELSAFAVVDGERGYFPTPTPGEFNAGPAFAGFVEPVEFSHARGFHEAPFDLELSTPTEGAEIHYTLDGRAPTADSPLYEGPLRIDGTSVIRAIASKADFEPAPSRTASFVFLEEVVTQDDAAAAAKGFPPMWGNVVADYAMDPRVAGPDDVFEGLYADTIRADLRALPSLFLTGDLEGIFGPQGIYTHSGSHGVAWERPVSAELVDHEGGGFQINCGLRIQGGAFRSHGLTRKHSLRLLFKGIYGPTKLRYALFEEGATTRFDTITLRSNSNDGWQWAAAQGQPLYIRDSFGRATRLAMGGVASHETFVHLYINGLYWGLYNPVERPDAAFSAAYHGGDKEQWDGLNSGAVVDGDAQAWSALHGAAAAGLEGEQAYAELGELLDLVDYADYMITNLYLGNSDWPRKNYWVGHHPDAGFKSYMWDSEWSLGLRSDLNTNRIGVSEGVAIPWAALLANPEFRVLVGDRMQRHFFNEGALYVDPEASEWDPEHPERNRPAARMVALARRVERALGPESARWGDQHAAEPYHREGHWRPELEGLLVNYFPQRSAVVLEQFRSADLFPDLPAPIFSRRGGPMAPDFVLSFESEAPVLFTLDGSDPRLPGGAVSEQALLAPAGGVAIGAVGMRVRVRARALDEGAWSALDEVEFTLAE